MAEASEVHLCIGWYACWMTPPESDTSPSRKT